MQQIATAGLVTPIGPLAVTADPAGIIAVRFAPAAGPPDPAAPPCLLQALDELAAYFAGRLTSFTVPLRPSGTPFQRAVWAELTAIPYGAAISYRDLAAAVGNPAAVRAVGAANGRNPLPILIPCHRVIGADGSLTGYGGGLEKKRWLLDHERNNSGH
ncbi:methylated-DNA--[protein]-cysteine S-methyltransferase [Anaeroselena agilis]|uniref:Methylated-DNA--protein-cysteine methyltransferase n=1 Tax=Anaeroselena agilis TaxID=3063788 RepID=A0ABU3P1E8_9FIRM|nr:methylated-DNA--[protein]-cysteine S-methyltransferase [Selenomonadales bacterium 4137-cl]